MAFTCNQVRLAARPSGLPTPDVWEHAEETLADPAPGHFVVCVNYLSLDPAMRGWMNDARSYVPPVGNVVGQLAEIKGGRAVGIAGGQEKCAWIVDELGFDAAICYRSEDVGKALRTHAPDGIDVYFDNVGGDILDAALTRLRRGARVPLCGAISQYNAKGENTGKLVLQINDEE